MAACPYCGHACRDKGALREHIRHDCAKLESDCIPPEHVRRMRQADFDRDPCYAALHEVGWWACSCMLGMHSSGEPLLGWPPEQQGPLQVMRHHLPGRLHAPRSTRPALTPPGTLLCLAQVQVDLGAVVVRPMHREHAFETALLLTEAFLVDRSPPAFPWMLCALPFASP